MTPATGDSMSDLRQKVIEHIKRNKLFRPGEGVVIGISGGPDSVCLLHILWSLQDELKIWVHAAHLDHGILPEEAKEAEYVADLCKRLGVPVSLGAEDAPAYRKSHGLSLEDAARVLRYNFLHSVARKVGAESIAVAHTADDQVETVLLNLIRGTGLKGLRGMSPVSRWKDIPVVRPLLEVDRKDTEDYCRSLALSPMFDPSNLDIRFRRNFLRHRVIPLLQSLNPRFKEGILRASQYLREDWDFLVKEVRRVGQNLARKEADGFLLERTALAKLHPSLKRHLLLELAAELGVSLQGVHIEGILRVLERSCGMLTLPAGLKLTVSYDEVRLSFSELSCPFPALSGEQKLSIPGETVFCGWRVVAEVRGSAAVLEGGSAFEAFLDLEKTGTALFVRARRPGDRFQPLGMGGKKKKLQDFMVDAKIPRSWRDRIPLVISPQGIAWVVGWRIAEWCRVTPETRQVLVLKFFKELSLEDDRLKTFGESSSPAEAVGRTPTG